MGKFPGGHENGSHVFVKHEFCFHCGAVVALVCGCGHVDDRRDRVGSCHRATCPTLTEGAPLKTWHGTARDLAERVSKWNRALE